MHEGPPENNEEEVPGRTEEILAGFRRRARSINDLDTTDPELISMTLHQGFERLGANPMIQKYETGVIPTIDSLERAANEARRALLEDPEDVEAEKLAKLIEGSIRSIRSWYRRYVASIIRFHEAKSSYFRAQTKDDEIEDMQKADSERRRIHNSLLSSLSTFNQQLEDAQGIVTFAPAAEWVPGVDLPAGSADSLPIIFSKSAIEDRNLIKNWAIAADVAEEIRTILKSIAPKD